MILTLFYPLLGHWAETPQALPRRLNVCAYVFKQNPFPAAVPACIDIVRSPAGEVVVRSNGFIPRT